MKANDIDDLQIIGKKRLQETFNLLMLGYNLKRKYNIIQKQKKEDTKTKQTKLTQ